MVIDRDGEPPSIPEGARLQFVNIYRAEVAKDDDDKPFSVFFLEVHCKTASPSHWTVYRRYTQFRQLNDLLRSEGYFVPVLPPKKIIGQFNADFVKQRKIDLEAWLYHLAEQHVIHPGAKDPQFNSVYRSFLTDNANIIPASLAHLRAESFHKAPPKLHEKVCLDDFELVKVIGKGSFGKVTLVRKKSDGILFAMKVLSKPNIVKRKQVEHTKTERRVLGKMKHPFIVHMYYAFQTEMKLYFVLDYAAGGELFYHLSRMKKFPEHVTRFFCAEITLALDALHNIGVVYRDLKPENILLDSEGHIKLADFGLAKEGVNDAAEGATSMCGTPEYLSPEVLNRLGHGTSVDWWNLGMVMYEMLTGLPPWYSTDRQKLFDRLKNAPLTFPTHVTRPAASLIAGLLNRNPQQRLGSNGGADVMRHPFFQSINWDSLYRRELTPPFDPCRNQDVGEARNFEDDFTSLPLVSIDADEGRSDRVTSDTFQNFTYEDESNLTKHMAEGKSVDNERSWFGGLKK